jgi:hypothetical protein
MIAIWVSLIGTHNQIIQAIAIDIDDLIVGAPYANPDGKLEAGKSYVVFGKGNSSAINLSAIADASNPLGGFVING